MQKTKQEQACSDELFDMLMRLSASEEVEA